MYLYCCSTTEEDGLTMSSGCLGWWTPHKPLPWASCRWLTRGMLPHSYPIIRAHTAPGTIIHSDEWAAYSRISRDIPHLQLEFVNRTDGVPTQNIESYWNRVKKKFKTMKGVDSHQLPSYLDEFMWWVRYRTNSEQAFDSS